MAIYQSSNWPLVIDFDEDMEAVQNSLSIVLYTNTTNNNKILKHWLGNEVEIDGSTIILPLTETETASFPVGDVYVEAKWLDTNGYTVFAQPECISVKYRKDKTILGGL